jgi:preprotein translocase subunit YajC
MTIQHLLSATIPWELLFLIVPVMLIWYFLGIKERINKQREKKMGRRRHFFS